MLRISVLGFVLCQWRNYADVKCPFGVLLWLNVASQISRFERLCCIPGFPYGMSHSHPEVDR